MKIKLFLKRSLVISIAISIGILLSVPSTVSASSNTLNFQSKIVNLVDGTNIDTGTPSCVVAGNGNDTCDFRVNIYDDPTAGNLLFSEDHINSEIGHYNGIFNLEINSVCNVVSDTGTDGNWTDNADPCVSNGGVDFSATDLWIEIEFDPTGTSTFSETFSRVEIRDVASARYAVSASYLDNLTSADFVQFRPGAVQTTTSANTLINLETTANTANPLLNINENGAGTPDLLRLQNTSSTVFQVANGGFTGIGAGATTAAWLDIGANTTTAAQLNLTPSAAVDVVAPNAGDLWFNGSNLYFDDGTTTFDLLAGSPCITCFHDGGDSFGALAVLGTNDNFSLAFETNGAEKMRLGADGTLGVATTTATSQVHIVTGGPGSTSGATTMTAVNGNSTFTTDAVITLNVGDYIVPNLQSTQSRVVTVGGTGTNFTVTPAFTANVTTRTFIIHRKGVTVEGARPLMALRNTQLGTQEWQLRVGALGPGSSSFDLFSQTTDQTALRIENDGDVLLGTDTNFGGIGNNSRLFVYGGDGGANIDVMGNAAQVDQATIELQSSDYSTSSASSRLQSYGVSGVGTTFGFANQYLGVLAFQEMDSALIATSNDTDLTFVTDSIVRATFDGTSGDLILTNDLAVNGGDISSTSATVNVFTSAGATTFNVGRTGATGTLNLMGGSADTGCTINGVTGDLTCSGNIVGGASGDFFEQGGNSFSANAVIGTNDNFSLSFETNGTTHATLSTAGDFTLNNDLAVNGGDLTTTAATFNLLNTNATTVNAFGATTTLNLAGGVASTGCTIDGSGNIDCTGLFNGVDLTDVLLNGGNTFGGPVTFGSNDNFALNFETNNVTQMSISNAGDVTINNDLAVNGGDITTTNATANLFTTNATTINMGDAANTINFGGGSGSTGCTMDTTTGSIDCSGNGTFGGDVNVNGGDLITSAGTFNLVNTGATVINGFGAATTINLGIAGASGTMNLMGGDASTGCTVDGTAGNFSCTNNATFGGDLAVNGGDITTTNATASVFNTNATTVNIGGASNTINLGGGDASTGCTIDATTGDLDCSGLINGVDLSNVILQGGNAFGTTLSLGSTDTEDFEIITDGTTALTISGADQSITTVSTVGIGTAANSASWLDIGANTTTTAQLNLSPSAAVDVTAPNAGDLWFNGTNLYFDDGTTTYDLLAGSPCITCFHDGGDSFGAGATLGTNDNFALNLETNGTTKVTVAAGGDVTLTNDLAVNGGDLTSTAGTFNLFNAGVTTLNGFGAATAVNLGIAGASGTMNLMGGDASTGCTVDGSAGNFSCTNNGTFGGDLAVNGGDLTTTAATFNLLNTNATTVNAFGATTTLNFAGGSASTGCTIDGSGNLDCTGLFNGVDLTNVLMNGGNTFGGPVILGSNDNFVLNFETNNVTHMSIGTGGDVTINNDLAVNGGDITTTNATANLFQTNATTVNIGGASNVINFGGGSGSTGCTMDTTTGSIDCTGNGTFGGDVNVNGGDLITSAATFNLINTNATTVNGFGAATTVNLGIAGASGTMNLMGGSASTGCSIDGTTGDLDCSGLINGVDLTNVLLNGGNTFGGTVTLGSNDNFALNFETNNVTQMSISNAGNVTINNDLAVNGGDLTTTAATFNLLTTNATTINMGDAANTINFGGGSASTGCTIDATTGDLDCSGLINGVDLSQAYIQNGNTFGANAVLGTNDNFSLSLETNGTTHATLSTAGNLTLNNDLAVNGGDLTTTAGTFNLVNAGATTVNAFGAATTVNLGIAGASGTMNLMGGDASTGCTVDGTAGNFSCTNNATFGGDLAVNGGDITTTSATASIFNTNATTVNIGGASNTINLGGGDASTGCTIDATTGDLDCSGLINGVDLSNVILQGGNTFGAAMTIGTNDNFGFNFETNGATQVSISNAGDVTVNQDLTVSGTTGIGTAANSASWLDIGANTTTTAQLNLSPSAAVDVSAPNAGDLWFNGTNLYFDDGTTTHDLLAGGACTTCFHQNGDSFGALAVLGTNDTFGLAFETDGTTRLTLDTSGHLTPNVDDTYDLGSNTNRFRDLYLGPATLNIGTSADDYDISFDTAGVGTLVFNEAGEDDDLRIEGDTDANLFFVDASTSRIGIGLNNPTALLSIQAATAAQSSLRIVSSVGVNPAAPNSGDLWWNGTNLNFRTATVNVDLLANCAITACFYQNGNTFGAGGVLGTNDAFGLAFETSGTTRLSIDAVGAITQTFPGTTTTGYTQIADSLTSGRGFDITSTATAFTGDLHRIALTGNNAANTGDILELVISGPASAARAFFISNQGTGTSMRVNDVAGDTTPFIIDNAGNVGVQYDTPGRSLDVFNDASINNNLVVQTDGGALYGSQIVTQDSFEVDPGSIGQHWEGALVFTGNYRDVDVSATGQYVSIAISAEQLRVSSDYGNTFTLRDAARGWTDIAISKSGQYQVASGSSTNLYTSSDYGVTWIARDAVRVWDEVAISADGKYMTAVIGNATAGFIYTSSDYGVTWTQRGPSLSWNSIGMSSDGKHQTAGSVGGQLYRSSDYGVNWTAVGPVKSWDETMAISSNGQYQTTAVGASDQLYTSSDYGLTWTARDVARLWASVDMSSDGRIQMATIRLNVPGNDVFLSTDHGVTWAPIGDILFDSSNNKYISMSPNAKYIYVTQDDRVRRSTSATFAAHGSLGVNTVFDATSQVSVFRNALAGTRQFGLRIDVDGNSDDARGIRIQANSDNCSTTGICRFIDIVDGDGTAIQSIRSNAGTLEFGGTSDERLKTDIAPTAMEGLQSLMGIVISDFRRVESEGKVETAGDLQTGFIAQNLLEAFPSAVYLEDTGYYSISTTRLLPLTMKAVQELNTKVDDNEVILETIGLTVDSQNVSLADLGDVVNTHATELLTLATADADQMSLYTALETRVAGLETSVAALDLRLAAVEGATGGVNYQPQIDALSARVTAIENGTLKDTATILIDTSFVEVTFAQAFAEAPIITLTPIDYLSGYAISEVTETGFRIIIAEPAVVDVVFNWVAVEK